MAKSKPIVTLLQSEIDRFMTFITIPENKNECWIWKGFPDKDGYGKINIRNRYIRSHRLSYFIFKNEDPLDLMVCHSCDSTCCVNPSHLFLGTAKDNKKDSVEKGRAVKGDRQWKARINTQQAKKLVKMWLTGDYSQPQLSEIFNISRSALGKIIRGETWKHLNVSDKNFRRVGYNAKLKPEQVAKIKELFKGTNESVNYITTIFSISSSTVYGIVKGRTYKHLLSKTA